VTNAEVLVIHDDGVVTLDPSADGPPLWRSDAEAAVAGATPPKKSSELTQWERLDPGRELRSQNGRYSLLMRSDGALILIDNGTEVWATDTSGCYGATLAMQPDNNLVLYAQPYEPDPSLRRPVWSTDTDNRTDEVLRLRLGDDGTLALRNAEGKPVHAIWSPGANELSPAWQCD
jgi:hypothetical protein